ncbi:MAG TPA: cold shock domain-containing protein [bacterium]|nr:cold shock domain-containing protein [bacterium]HPP86496.1 cold shock domain-containing protein [bacterium]
MPIIPNTKQIFTGKILDFDNAKGFGYIQPDDISIDEQIFFHFSDIIMPKTYLFRTVEKGDIVQFEIKLDSQNKILKAYNVEKK